MEQPSGTARFDVSHPHGFPSSGGSIPRIRGRTYCAGALKAPIVRSERSSKAAPAGPASCMRGTGATVAAHAADVAAPADAARLIDATVAATAASMYWSTMSAVAAAVRALATAAITSRDADQFPKFVGLAAGGSRIRTFRPSQDQCRFELVEPWGETTWRARGSFRRARIGPIHHAAWDAYVRATVNRLVTFGRAHNGLEHRNAVQDVLGWDRIGPLAADRRGEGFEFSQQRIEALVLDDLGGGRDVATRAWPLAASPRGR
jgi:hypothetical protein